MAEHCVAKCRQKGLHAPLLICVESNEDIPKHDHSHPQLHRPGFHAVVGLRMLRKELSQQILSIIGHISIMFKRNSGKNSPVETAAPIDEDEQTKIAEEIKTQTDKQYVTTRSVFRYLFVIIAVILFVCLLYTVFSPYQMEHQKHFKDLIPLYGFFSYYCGSIYCYVICSFIVQVRVNCQRRYSTHIAVKFNCVSFVSLFYTHRSLPSESTRSC